MSRPGWSGRGPHLLAEGAQAHVIETVQLEGLAQHGVEGLGDAVHSGGVGRHGEGGHTRKYSVNKIGEVGGGNKPGLVRNQTNQNRGLLQIES